jgi:hypothetical protein
MKKDKFILFLNELKLSNEKIDNAIDDVNNYEQYLNDNDLKLENLSYDDFFKYSEYLISINKNNYETYLNLYQYGSHNKINGLIIGTLEVIDGCEVIDNLSKKVRATFGKKFQEKLFDGVEIPPLGLHPSKKPETTKKLVSRMESEIGEDKCARFFNQCMRKKYSDNFEDNKKFKKIKNIDEFLKEKHKEFVKSMEQHMNEGRLWFTQEIDADVLAYYKSRQVVSIGVRIGNHIYIEKTPYNTKQYLKETDLKLKKYYFCHCPWVREGLLKSDKPVPPVFCNCSAGFHKRYWENLFECPVEMEVEKSILNGDLVCVFKMKIP